MALLRRLNSVSMTATAIVLCSIIAITGCSTIALYNQKAYELETSVKAEALIVVAMGTEQFSSHVADVKALKLDTEKAYEYAKGIPKNEISTKQWEIILNPKGGSLYGFLTLWEKNGKLSKEFVAEKDKQIGKQFDQIIELEENKPKTGLGG